MLQTQLLILLIFSTTVRSSFADQAISLNKGDAAPFSGVLMDQEKSNLIKNQLQERDLFEKIIASQTTSINLLRQNGEYSEKKVGLLLDQNDKLAERLQSAQGLNNWERLGLVVLGIAMTVGAGYAIKQVTK